MNINLLFQTVKQISKTKEKFAEITSSCSDTPQRLWCRGGYPQTAKQAMALLVVLPIVSLSTRNKDLYLDIVEHVSRMTTNYDLEGEWKIVAELLRNYFDKSPIDHMEVILRTMNSNDWFGNFVPELRRAIRSLRIESTAYSVVEDTRPVHRSLRRRGYDDKGTLQTDPWPRIPVPPKEKKVIDIPDPRSHEMWWRFRKRGR